MHTALQPAFLSRSETPERKRDLLGYFYREHPRATNLADEVRREIVEGNRLAAMPASATGGL